jgi:hypothetical protein
MQGLDASAGNMPMNDKKTIAPIQVLLLEASFMLSPFGAHHFTLLWFEAT